MPEPSSYRIGADKSMTKLISPFVAAFFATRSSVKHRSVRLSAVMLIALWVGIVAKHLENRSVDEDSATRDLQNFALLAEENVLRSIGEMDKAILYLRRVIEAAGDKPDFHYISSTTDILSNLIVQVAIIDEAGIMRASNAGPQPAPPIDLSDREHYRFHIGRTDDRLFVSKPVIGRASKKWSVQLTRKFKKTDGAFGGVIVASFNPNHFKRSYGRVDLGEGSFFSLIGTDGVVRALSGSDGLIQELGQDMTKTPLAALLQRGVNSNQALWVKSGTSERLIAVHPVAGHDLHVVASLPEATIFAGSERNLNAMLGGGLLMSLLIAFAGYRFGQEERMRVEKDRQLVLTLEHMTQGIMLVTSDLRIPVMNRQCVRLLDLPEEFVRKEPRFDELVELQVASGEFVNADIPEGCHPIDLFGPSDTTGRFECYERARPDGKVIEVRSARLPDGGFVRTFSDITQRRLAQAQADKLAAEDALTGLANRRTLIRSLDLLLGANAPNGSDKVAVFYLDLDRFKMVNDSQGHSAGDHILREVAERLKENLRATDLVARLGGDEFAVLLTLKDDDAACDLVARRLVDALSRPYDVNGSPVLIGVSIGIAVAPDDGQTSNDLLVAADLALYAAKSAGRGTFRYFSRDLNEGMKARQELEADLRQALSDRQLELHYQPIVQLKTGGLIGFEALARWNHERLGMIPPDKFIPIAEDCGLIQALGRWALETACIEAMKWPSDMMVAVNLSPLQFADPSLVATIERALNDSGLAANRLEIEITEGILIKNTLHVMDTLKTLKNMGVRIAMDDFGTGYSSLAYLQRFDFDRIKVDRCFVNRLGNDASSKAIVRAVIDIAASRGMQTTAEGVETESQRADLAALGCDEAQGYLFSRPVPSNNLQPIIQQWLPKSRAA